MKIMTKRQHLFHKVWQGKDAVCFEVCDVKNIKEKDVKGADYPRPSKIKRNKELRRKQKLDELESYFSRM